MCNMINVNRIVDWLKQSSDWPSQLNHWNSLDNFAKVTMSCLSGTAALGSCQREFGQRLYSNDTHDKCR